MDRKQFSEPIIYKRSFSIVCIPQSFFKGLSAFDPWFQFSVIWLILFFSQNKLGWPCSYVCTVNDTFTCVWKVMRWRSWAVYYTMGLPVVLSGVISAFLWVVKHKANRNEFFYTIFDRKQVWFIDQMYSNSDIPNSMVYLFYYVVY